MVFTKSSCQEINISIITSKTGEGEYCFKHLLSVDKIFIPTWIGDRGKGVVALSLPSTFLSFKLNC